MTLYNVSCAKFYYTSTDYSISRIGFKGVKVGVFLWHAILLIRAVASLTLNLGAPKTAQRETIDLIRIALLFIGSIAK
jgi:hypothetical protein